MYAPDSSRRRKVSVERPFFPTATQRTRLALGLSARSSAKRAADDLGVERACEPTIPGERDDRDRLDLSRCSRSGSRTDDAARPTPAMSSFIVSA